MSRLRSVGGTLVVVGVLSAGHGLFLLITSQIHFLVGVLFLCAHLKLSAEILVHRWQSQEPSRRWSA